MTENQDRLTTAEAAKYLGFAPITLKKWRYGDKNRAADDRQGPPYFKRGRVYYYIADLDNWISQNRVQ